MTLPPIVERYLDAYNRRDVDALVDCVAETILFENVSNSGEGLVIEGRAAFADLAGRSAAMFTARHQMVRTAVVAGDSVALEIDWTGTPAADIGPMKAGPPVAMRGASFIALAGGKIVRIVDLG